MKWVWFVGLAGVNLVCLLAAEPQALPSRPSPVVGGIQITSTRVNLGGAWRRRTTKPTPVEPDKTFLDIFRDGEAYKLGDDVVDTKLVAALANALREPVNPEPNREDLGFTSAWLKANASSLGQNFAATVYYGGGNHIHQAAFESAFADPAVVDKAVPLLFQHRFCVDCDHFTQSVEISVRFDDGTRIDARTSSESPYMLPWHLQSGGRDVVAYNADISRAIAALMPEVSANRSRLAGEHLATELGHIVLNEEEKEARLQDIENETGETLSAIRSRYTVGYAGINKLPESGLFGTGEAESNLHLQLTTPDWPPNFREEVALAYVNGSVVGTEKFLSDGPKFEKLVLSVPWLGNFVRNHPKVPIELSFVHDASLSDAALTLFSADMKAIGREKQIPEVEGAKDKIALLSLGSGTTHSQWLVFPDQHMLLWRYWQLGAVEPDLPPWAASAARPCSEPKNFIHCVGRDVSPAGGSLDLEQGHKQ
jgi:hypothetical protein